MSPTASHFAFLFFASPFLLSASASPDPLQRDFDHDGVLERIFLRDGTPHVERFDEKSQSWKDADFQLPDGLTGIKDDGSLHFLDLNGDGFDDLILSGESRIYIALWSSKVQPNLGWTKGWSQPVRSSERSGTGVEPPPFPDAEVRIADAHLLVVKPGNEESRIPLTHLLAFDVPPPLSPQEALRTFRLHPDFQIELVASEPLIVDPVAFDWGPDGRLWVVEMRDYPSGIDGKGKPGGVVKVLEDRDDDGLYESSTVFLNDIPFPTGVMPWRNGALISAAPDILFAEDTDSDGRADKKHPLFSGFWPGNQQHRANGFEWGLDGWIHTANGDSGGLVLSHKTGAAINISGRDVRFKPATGEIETVSSQSQFGRRRDDFGNWFGNNNPTWLWHVGLPEHYLRRNPKLAIKSPKRILANYENPTAVFPASPPTQRPNQPWSLNHVTSACSPTPYRDDLFGPDFSSSIFISEPVHNAVHREVLGPDGSGFRSRRAEGEQSAEFLASTDPWFRPTTLRTGPDGALYIADFYRFVIEHPEWISPETQARLDLRAGHDKGRIYRFSPKNLPRRPIPDLTALSPGELADALDSPNGWQRDTAQRLLSENPASLDLSPQIEALLHIRHRPQVRVQALATLGMLGILDTDPLLTALSDPHPGVRIEALRQAEPFAPSGDRILFEAASALSADGDPRVRLQAAFSLGAWPPDQSAPFLAQIAGRDPEDEWIRAAVLSSLPPESDLFASLNNPGSQQIPHPAPPIKPTTSDRAKAIAQFSAIADAKGDPTRGRSHFQTHCAACHRFRGEGNEVGPDLAMVRGKPTPWLLAAILDPSAAVEARFAAWTATTTTGETLVGIIGAETANSLTLRLPGGIDRPLLRTDIKSLNPAGLTLMPAGFESVLDLQAMADLLAHLNAPDPK